MNQTTFQCEFQILQGMQSSVGTLTVMGKAMCNGKRLCSCVCAEYSQANCENLLTSHRSPNPSSYQGGGKETDLTGNIMGHIQPYLMW